MSLSYTKSVFFLTRHSCKELTSALLSCQVDRESRILSDAYPYIASRLLTDSAPELQGALQQLLFKDGEPRLVPRRWSVIGRTVLVLGLSLDTMDSVLGSFKQDRT